MYGGLAISLFDRFSLFTRARHILDKKIKVKIFPFLHFVRKLSNKTKLIADITEKV